jgi:putative folate metabolism gamma-glutamate ligase
MHTQTYKTSLVRPFTSLFELIDTYLPKLAERSVFVVTSKVVSLCEGSIIKKDQVGSKKELIQKESDAYLIDSHPSPLSESIQLTIKNGILIPSAGIDESNGEDIYILYPQDLQQSATSIWEHLRKRDNLKEVGVIITDSHTTPMRWGVLGIGLSWCGFNPLYNYIGQPDCFGKPLRVTKRNNLDALAISAVFCMGEGNEQTPFAVITDAPKMEFQDRPPLDHEVKALSISMEDDLYAPILAPANWVFKS